MIEQLSNAIKFLAFFTAAKTGKTGLTVTVDVFNPAGTQVVTGGSATELAGGFYYYSLASGSVGTEGEYVAVFKTSDTSVDQQHIPALWVVGRAGVENLDASSAAIKAKTDNLPASPAAVGSAMTLTAAYDAAKTANSVAPDNASITAIKAKTDNLPASPAAVGSAMTLTGAYDAAKTANSVAPDNASITAIKAKTDNLPASPAATGAAMTLTAAYDAAKTANSVAPDNASITAIKAKTDNLPVSPAAVGSAMTLTAAYDAAKTANSVAPDNASIAAIKAKTDNLPASPAATGAAMTLTVAYDAAKTANSVAPDNVGIAAIKAKTDNLPAAPAATGDLAGLADSADVAAILAAIAQPVTLPDPAPEGYGGSFEGEISGLTAEQAQQLLDLHTRLTEVRAALLDKLNIGEAEQPVFVLPDAPLDLSLCRVYGYLETPDNKPAANIKITFELVAADPTKSERLISGRKVSVITDADGKIVDGDDNPYLELQRNDLLTPAGTKYRVTCPKLNLDKEITLAAETFDLLSVVT